MNRTFFSFIIIILFSVSCSAPNQAVSLNYADYRIEKSLPADTGMAHFLQPYASSMNSTMNRVIGFTSGNMVSRQPESNLGNFLADCIYKMSEKKFGKTVDAGFVNKGGIRSSLPKGNITIGKVYELMPFDNLVVLLELRGSVLKAFLDKTANENGWPVSETVKMKIVNKKATDISIKGKPLDENGVYVIAVSDYLANGGDNCDMLRNIPQQNKGYVFRDAIIDYINLFTQQGKPVEAKIENRVSNGN